MDTTNLQETLNKTIKDLEAAVTAEKEKVKTLEAKNVELKASLDANTNTVMRYMEESLKDTERLEKELADERTAHTEQREQHEALVKQVEDAKNDSVSLSHIRQQDSTDWEEVAAKTGNLNRAPAAEDSRGDASVYKNPLVIAPMKKDRGSERENAEEFKAIETDRPEQQLADERDAHAKPLQASELVWDEIEDIQPPQNDIFRVRVQPTLIRYPPLYAFAALHGVRDKRREE